jgi:uncharacterized protein (DUF362 family)
MNAPATLLAEAPWKCRRMKTHFLVETTRGIRVAEVRYSKRPDGSTSEAEAAAIALLPEIVSAAQEFLTETGCGRFVVETSGSAKLRAVLDAIGGDK